MCDIYKGCPRSKPKTASDEWKIELNFVDAAEVLPFRRKRWERVTWESKAQETLERIISGVRNEDCGGRVQNAHIPSEAAAEA